MSVDIIILSYNRPRQLQRILDSFIGVTYNQINIIIKDDCSPQIVLIEELYIRYRELLNVNLVLHKNPINLGYDMNLLDSFNIGDSEYIFLLSNDDYIEADKISNFLDFINLKRPDGLICSYKVNGARQRVSPLDCDNGYTANLLYDSILFSGLVFKRNIGKYILPYFEFLKNCIYSQVFLFALIKKLNMNIIKYSDDLLILGGDGENFFGKNSSSIGENDLADRDSPLSCFRYQLRLLKVVNYIDAELHPGFCKIFTTEYSRRLLGFLFKLRSLYSKKQYLEFQKDIFFDHQFYTRRLYLSSVLISYIPQFICNMTYNLGKRFLKKSG